MTTRLKTAKTFFSQFQPDYIVDRQSDENGFEVFVGPNGDPLNGVVITVQRDCKLGVRVKLDRRGDGWFQVVTPSSSKITKKALFIMGAVPRPSWGQVLALLGANTAIAIAIFIRLGT